MIAGVSQSRNDYGFNGPVPISAVSNGRQVTDAEVKKPGFRNADAK
jgi:hypothetical protein